MPQHVRRYRLASAPWMCLGHTPAGRGAMSEAKAPAGRTRAIAVCGPGQVDDPTLGEAAVRVGMDIVRGGCALICGGLGGVMDHAARGARQARADREWPPVVGIVPGDSFEEANRYCDLVIPSGMGIARNVLLMRAADAVIAMGGGAGTLSELALAWQLHKPIIALRMGAGWAEQLAGQRIDDRCRDAIVGVDRAEDAVTAALTAIETRADR